MKQDEIEQLKAEIDHIFESGANEIRILNTVKTFIERRYESNHLLSKKPSVSDEEIEKMASKYNLYKDEIRPFISGATAFRDTYLKAVDCSLIAERFASLQTQEKDKEIAELKEARDEREELIKAFDAIRMEFEGRKWLMEGRGNYRYDDEKYKEEVRYIMDAFNEINGNLWRKIKSKTFEYRNAIESPLKSTIESQQKEIEELKRAIEDEKKVCLRVMDYNSELESQLSEVTKERDKYKQAFFNTQQKF